MDFGERDGGEGGEERCEGEVRGRIGVEEVDIYGAPVCRGHILDRMRGMGEQWSGRAEFWFGGEWGVDGPVRRLRRLQGCGRNVLRGFTNSATRYACDVETLSLLI